jgi:hypothetical protein
MHSNAVNFKNDQILKVLRQPLQNFKDKYSLFSLVAKEFTRDNRNGYRQAEVQASVATTLQNWTSPDVFRACYLRNSLADKNLHSVYPYSLNATRNFKIRLGRLNQLLHLASNIW